MSGVEAGLWRLVARAEVAQVRRFGASVVSTLFRTPVLVLETTGRRSGRGRSTVLAALRVPDGELVVVGGAGGQGPVPDWVANLRADPRVSVTIDRRVVVMEATELAGEERARAWSVLSQTWPRIETYQRRAGRLVPVVHLRPRSEPASSARLVDRSTDFPRFRRRE